MKDQASVQSKRKATLRGTCERRRVAAEEDTPLYTQLHTFVVDKYKMTYCLVPVAQEVDTSNWKGIFMILNGEDIVKGHNPEKVQSHTRSLSSYTPKQRQNIMKNYRKFFLVQDPLKRVLSAYRGKFENVDHYLGNKAFHVLGKQIVRKFKKKPSAAAVQTGENVTWTEFVDYLTHPMERDEVERMTPFQSNHWKEIHKLCSPCTIDYDVIGKLETVNDDAKYVLNLIDAPEKIIPSESSHPTNSSDKGTFDKYFSQLNKKTLTQLWDLYKLDYELFGYSKPAIIPD